MKKALVTTHELIKHYQNNSVLGYRIADVFDTEIFEPASGMFWIDVNDDFDMISASLNYYNLETNTIEIIPVDPELIKLAEAKLLNKTKQDQNQPVTTGTQTL
jgi:hypothetical protein